MKVTIHDYDKPLIPISDNSVSRNNLEDWTKNEISNIVDVPDIFNTRVEVFNGVTDWENTHLIAPEEGTSRCFTIHFGGDVLAEPTIIKKNINTFVIDAGIDPITTSMYQDAIKRISNLIMEDIETSFYVGGEYMEMEIKGFTKDTYETLKRELEDQLDTTRSNIIDLRTKLTRYIRTEETTRVNYDRINREDYNYADKIIKELTNLNNHPKIKSVGFKKGEFIMKTHPISIYEPQNDEYYEGGEFKVKVGVLNSYVRIYGTQRRHGYWSSSDPHPHVSGIDASPCLGNVASSISELCGQNEFYGLAMVVLSFLESANIDDEAGANVTRWDMIDPETREIIGGGVDPEDDEDSYTCDRCGDQHNNREDAYHIGDDVICDDCYDEHVIRCEACETAIYNEDGHYSDEHDEQLCRACHEDNDDCAECERSMITDNMHFSVDHDADVCQDCIEALNLTYDEGLGGYTNGE